MSHLVLSVIAVVGVMALPQVSQAQSAATGNRANGFDYQPTQGEVANRAKSAHLPPPPANTKQLATIDRDLLRKEGASTQSVPNVAPAQPNGAAPSR